MAVGTILDQPHRVGVSTVAKQASTVAGSGASCLANGSPLNQLRPFVMRADERVQRGLVAEDFHVL